LSEQSQSLHTIFISKTYNIYIFIFFPRFTVLEKVRNILYIINDSKTSQDALNCFRNYYIWVDWKNSNVFFNIESY